MSRWYRSRLGWLLAVIHAVIFVVLIKAKGTTSPEFEVWLNSFPGFTTTMFAGRPFHFAYEALPFKLLLLVDIPGTLVALALALLFAVIPWHPGYHVGSYVEAALQLAGTTAQWLFVGAFLQQRLARRKLRHSRNSLSATEAPEE